MGSLFSGVGGLDWGLESAFAEAGILARVAWQVEREEFPRRVLAKHWPHADRSVTDVCNAGLATLAPVDLICGGFPCQDLSYAGKGAGLAGARSGLWSEYVRIVRELRPRVVVVENVAALLARGIGTVLGDLAEAGYDASWRCIRASDVGAPHRRERLFIVAYGHRGGSVWSDPRSERAGWDALERDREALGHTNESRLEGRGEPKPECADQRAARPSGAERSDDDRRGLADAERVRELQPQGREPDERRRTGDGGQDVADAGCEREREPHDETKAERNGRQEPWPNARGERGRRAQSGMGGIPDGVSAGLVLPSRWPAGPGQAQESWEAPRVAQGVKGRAAMLKAYGNAVVPHVAREVGRWIIREGWLS